MPELTLFPQSGPDVTGKYSQGECGDSGTKGKMHPFRISGGFIICSFLAFSSLPVVLV